MLFKSYKHTGLILIIMIAGCVFFDRTGGFYQSRLAMHAPLTWREIINGLPQTFLTCLAALLVLFLVDRGMELFFVWYRRKN